jgi:hypothetical protein
MRASEGLELKWVQFFKNIAWLVSFSSNVCCPFVAATLAGEQVAAGGVTKN